MQYSGMPMGMWILFRKSFRTGLVAVFGYSEADAVRIATSAKAKYKKIIGSLPEFEKADRFKVNIVSCAMLSAFLLSMEKKPDVDCVADYYSRAMMIKPMQWFCRMEGRKKFGKRDVLGMQKTAALNAADRNPYSWNMEYLPYPDGSGYEARFTKCGICTLMKALGLFAYVPAMCQLDYTMAEAGGYAFLRKHTLASGGPCCDCGYKKKERSK